MTPTKILITGATGFIGTRLCERLTLHYKLPYRALVRRFTKANRIARMGAEMVGGDLMKPDKIQASLAGCDTVVHLAHSDDETATRETRNLLTACQREGIRRFVHVSSISVHGPYPGPECEHESTATIQKKYGESYSDAKAAVERRIMEAIQQKGLQAVILRPGVVYGPYSPFVTVAVNSGRQGELSLIDDGAAICNAVFVDDVCDAIHCGLTGDRGLGQAFFITADDRVTWKDFLLTFARMAGQEPVLSNFDSTEVRDHWHARRATLKSNLKSFLKLVGSPSFHRELSTVPALGEAIRRSKQKLSGMLSEEQKFGLKSKFQAPVARKVATGPSMPDMGKLVRESCHVKFSNQLAKEVLGWQPRYDFAQGAAMTKLWLEFARLIPTTRT